MVCAKLLLQVSSMRETTLRSVRVHCLAAGTARMQARFGGLVNAAWSAPNACYVFGTLHEYHQVLAEALKDALPNLCAVKVLSPVVSSLVFDSS